MYRYCKRFIDITLSFLGLIILCPVFAALSFAVKISSKGPVFFKQKRIGMNKELFMMYKFRTMRTDAPSSMPTHLLKNPHAYITPIGLFLRKTSLDELPQLINILRGDMSIVGPRPALWNQYDLAAARDKYGANAIRPGLTGLAQIKGRDELPIDVKAAYDGEYIKRMSLLFDLQIIFRTVFSVIKAEGIKEGGQKGNATSGRNRR